MKEVFMASEVAFKDQFVLVAECIQMEISAVQNLLEEIKCSK
jgi:hypothetical protein